MAWDDFEQNGVAGKSGDKPVDEMTLAIQRITAAYEDRFDRKPTTTELVYAFEIVVTSNASQYVSDPKGLMLGSITIKRSKLSFERRDVPS